MSKHERCIFRDRRKTVVRPVALGKYFFLGAWRARFVSQLARFPDSPPPLSPSRQSAARLSLRQVGWCKALARLYYCSLCERRQ